MTYIKKIISLRRLYKILIMLSTDLLIIPLVFYTAVAVRLGTFTFAVEEYWWLILLCPVLIIPVFVRIGLYRAVIRYLDIKFLWTILLGVTFGTLMIATVVALARINSLPRTSLGIFWIFTSAYVGASRLLARGVIREVESRMEKRKRIAIYGAGRAGTQLAYALMSSREYTPVMFFDDSKDIQRSNIMGLKVYSTKNIRHLLMEKDIDEVLLAMPSIPKSRQREIIESIKSMDFPLKILPGIADVVSGKVHVEDIREVQIEDLLGRDQVAPREELLRANILGKNICVTGAGGSIGSELCRQIVRFGPKSLILIDQNEYSLYEIERELNKLGFNFSIHPILESVCNEDRINNVFNKFKVDTVFHAAAYKHVPLVEANVEAGVYNNVQGTLAVANAAIKNNVSHFILISTDKAVRPTNIMGASKRISELILQGLAQYSPKTKFSMVRFGNVLGSSGSVVPLFTEQLKRGGPITVTHPDVIRYFMTIPEAAQLVIQAGALAKGGEVFVLDMGESVKIYDLAKRMIELSGLKVKDSANESGDIEIVFTGLRPGEKLYEELLIDSNNSMRTIHPSIMVAKEYYIEWPKLQLLIADVNDSFDRGDREKMIKTVSQIVAEYQPS